MMKWMYIHFLRESWRKNFVIFWDFTRNIVFLRKNWTMSQTIYAPNPTETDNVTVFLAGSIEQGKAEKWQDKITDIFKDVEGITFLNPRRPDWDPTWGEDNPKLIEQINWEQDSLLVADLVFIYFDPNTKSVVTMMELGQVLERKADRIIVICPKGFWRRSNVDVTCGRYGVDIFDSFDEGVSALAAKMLSMVGD